MAAQKAAGASFAPESVNTPTQKQKTDTAQHGAPAKMYEVVFRVYVTREQLKALGDFMQANGIKPERVPMPEKF